MEGVDSFLLQTNIQLTLLHIRIVVGNSMTDGSVRQVSMEERLQVSLTNRVKQKVFNKQKKPAEYGKHTFFG